MPLIRHDAEYATYSRPQLALVICQIGFEPILRLTSAAAIAPLQEFLRDRYPTLARVGGLELRFGPQGLDAEALESAGGWSFASSDNSEQVVVASDSLAYQTRQHKTYEALRAEFDRVISFFVEEYKPTGRVRLGLRYINRVTFESVESVAQWRDLVRPELLGMVATDELIPDEHVRHSFGQTRLAQHESQMIARYGLLDEGVTTHPEVEPTAGPSFLLDLDHFDVRRFSELSVAAALEQLDGFHDDLHRVFNWCLSRQAHELLGIEEDGRLEGVQSV